MVLHIKHSTRTPLQLLNILIKVAGCKINTQKSLAFLYTNNKHTEKEVRDTISFRIAKTKQNKTNKTNKNNTTTTKKLGINLSEPVLCNEVL